MVTTTKKLKPKESQSEFVVGGRSPFYSPNNATRDRVETRLDKRAIDQMRLDAEVESDVSFLFDSVLSDGIEVTPAVSDEEDAEFQEAQEIADFMSVAISTSQRPLEAIVKEMCKAGFYSGVKVGEIVLRYQNDARVDGKLVLDRINAKPNEATAFVTDQFYNVLGLVGARRQGQVAAASLALSPDEIIAREKFLVISFELEDNDPRGLSQIRAAYEDYCDKQLTRAQWKEWRRTFAIPKKVGVTPDKAARIKVQNADGSDVIENGVPKTISAEKGLMVALEGFANNSTITVPFGTSIAQLEVAGTGIPFFNAIKYNNSGIRKVILGDSLATGEADKDARAARESAKDVVDIRKQAFRNTIANAIERDIFLLLTVVNFGEEKAHLTPKCFLGDTEANDWATDLQAASGAGYLFADEHMAQLDTQFGLEPRGQTEAQPVDEGSE